MCTQVAALLLTAYLLTMDMVLMLRLQVSKDAGRNF